MASVTGFSHGGVTVRDMDRALIFYRDGLGLEVEFDTVVDGDYLRRVLALEFAFIRAVSLRIPNGGHVELLEYSGIARRSAAGPPCDYGSGHLCLLVNDVAAMYGRLTDLGFEARGSVVDITKGPNKGARSCYMLDPDGYPVELFERA